MARFAETQYSTEQAINTLADAINANKNGLYTTEVGASKTLAASVVINGTYVTTGAPGATAVLFPTAANIVAAMNNPQVGSMADFHVKNETDNTMTMTTNTGLTLDGTVAIPTLKSQVFRIHVTAVSTPAVTIVGVLTAPI